MSNIILTQIRAQSTFEFVCIMFVYVCIM